MDLVPCFGKDLVHAEGLTTLIFCCDRPAKWLKGMAILATEQQRLYEQINQWVHRCLHGLLFARYAGQTTRTPLSRS